MSPGVPAPDLQEQTLSTPSPTSVLLVDEAAGTAAELGLAGAGLVLRRVAPGDLLRTAGEGWPDVVALGPGLGEERALALAREWSRGFAGGLLFLRAEAPPEAWLRAAYAFERSEVAVAPFLPEVLRARVAGLVARAGAGGLAPDRARELEVVTHSVPALLSYVDPERRYRFVNRAYEAWFGHRVEEVAGRSMREVLGDAAYDRIAPWLDRAFAGETVSYTIDAPYRDGGARVIDAVYVPDLDAGGRVRGVSVLVQDATGRKRAEDALRHSEAEFRSLFESSAAGVAQADPATGRFVRVNQRFCEITGYPEEELLARTFSDITHPEDRERDRELALPVFRGESPAWESEKRYLRPDGRTVWVHVSGRLLKDAGGVPYRTLASILDVTERRAAEAALRDSEAALRSLLDNTPSLMGVVELAPDGSDLMHVLDNAHAERFFGVGEGGTVGKWARRDLAVAPAVFERWLEAYRRARQTGRPVRISHEVPSEGGRAPGWLDVSVSFMGTGANGRDRFCYTAVDDTERVRAEDRARFLLRLDDAVRPLTEPNAITGTAARLLGEFLDVSRCAYAEVEADEDTFDLTGDHARGVPSIVGRYRFAAFGEDVLRLMRADRPFVTHDIEARGVPPEILAAYRGTRIRAVICVPLHKGGRFVAAMAVHEASPRSWRDDEVELVRAVASRAWESIERARVNRELRDSERALQEADRRKDQFLATLAHELRNPLAPISYALQVWPVVAKDPARADELRALMDRQVGQLKRLIDDLLDVSRISRGKIELRRDHLDLATVVEGALEAVRPFVASCRHELKVTLPPEPLTLDGDPGRLMQVFGNLVHNAAKYTGRNGHLEVLVAREGAEAVVRVRDDGPGVPRDMLDTIFDMFTQVDQTLHRAQGGLGIGLTLVRTLVELHGGRVEARGGPGGRGSEFVVRLPAEPPLTAPVDRAAAHLALGVRSMARSMRVLVLDDVRASADTLAMMFRALGQDVRVTYDGATALEVAAAFRPQVVLSDLAMPGMDGYEVARRLRRAFGRTPVLVALTGYGQEEDRRRAIEAGFDHHLVKPASVDALVAVLEGAPDESADGSVAATER